MSNKFLTVIYDMSRPGMQQKASLLLLEADWTASGWSHAFADRDEARKELYRLQESIAAAPQVVADELRPTLVESGALRQYLHNDSTDANENFVFAYDKDITDRYIAGLHIAAAPVQAQEPVAYVWSVNGMVKTGGDPVFDSHEKFFRAPVQPVAVPVLSEKMIADYLAGQAASVLGADRVMGVSDPRQHVRAGWSAMFAAPAAQGDKK